MKMKKKEHTLFDLYVYNNENNTMFVAREQRVMEIVYTVVVVVVVLFAPLLFRCICVCVYELV